MEYPSLPLNPPLIVPPWRYNQPQQKSYRIPIGQCLSPIGYGSRAERRAARLGCRAAGRSLLPPRRRGPRRAVVPQARARAPGAHSGKDCRQATPLNGRPKPARSGPGGLGPEWTTVAVQSVCWFTCLKAVGSRSVSQYFSVYLTKGE